ncbi:hypothetical protein pb186bvf_014596 [Paramecium bursaria]
MHFLRIDQILIQKKPILYFQQLMVTSYDASDDNLLT